jgi:hypothetical protein
MIEGLIERIERTAGVTGLVEILAARLEPTDLQSLLLEVYRRLAMRVTPARLLDRYEKNRFVGPSVADARQFVEFDRLAWSLLPAGYAALELSPVCPLGTNSVIASVDQNKVVSTIRNTEVVADSTNVLALECASRRRELLRQGVRPKEPVLLASSHRLLRAQQFSGPRSFAHFRVLSLCAAGRDEGSFRFETTRLLEHLCFYLELLRALARQGGNLMRFRVAVTDLTNDTYGAVLEERVLAPLAVAFPEARCHLAPERTSGRGYYRNVCFKLFAADEMGNEIEVGDGGMTDWTRALISDQKERFLISGVGVERLCIV